MVSGWRVVGLVKVKKVYKNKKRAGGVLFQPTLRGVQDLGRRTFKIQRTLDSARVKGAVVCLEALRQAEMGGEEISSNESRGVIAMCSEYNRERHGSGR